VGVRLWIWTAVDTASAQNVVGSFDPMSSARAMATIVRLARSAIPFAKEE